MSEQTDSKARPPVDAKAMINVSGDRLEAEITLMSPQNKGADLTLEQLREIVSSKGIVAGILDEQLQALADKPVYDRPVIIAEGIKPQDGEDGKIIYEFDIVRDIRPKERKDGSVDFKDLGIIQTVAKDELLCTRHSPTQGKPGSDIYGSPLPAKAGKDAFISAGKNTTLSEDKMTLRSSIDGQVQITNGKVCVFDSYTVKGDVSPATGNIKFSGNVVITGGVLTGFSVEAAGDVEISGVVEAAQIKAGGSLIIRGGFSGGDTGEIEAGGSITTRFVQSGKVTLQGDLSTTYILNSDVFCGGSVNLQGKGLIVGGQISALKNVVANTIGSASATPTVIEVGNAPGVLKRVNEIPKEISDCDKNIGSSETVAKSLLKIKLTGSLTPEFADKLKKTLRYLNQLKALKDDLESELEFSEKQLEQAGNGIVKVRKTAYPGVKLIVGKELLTIKKQYEYTTFSSSPGTVSISPFS